MNAQIIAITNQKGGVGKTTTTVNLGVGLARQGRRVLLVDGDPQGSLTISMGMKLPDKDTVIRYTRIRPNVWNREGNNSVSSERSWPSCLLSVE